MKRYLIFLAATFCAVISCSKEEILKTDEVKLVPVTIFAECGDFDTKSIATWNSEESKYNIKWEANDALSVFTNIDADNHEFTARQTEKLATFTGELPAGDNVTIYPIMPYDKDAYKSENTVYTSIPNKQDGDFYNVVLAGWPRPDTKAEGEGEKDFFYQFEAVSGILKFHFDQTKIACFEGNAQHVVRLSITADRPIAGDAMVSFTGGKPVMTANPNGTGSNMYNTITISAPDGAQSLPDGDYYIATLPIKKSDFPDGLDISVKCETKEGEVAYINATIGKAGQNHILTANVVKNIGTVKTTDYVPHFTSEEFTVDNQGTKVSFSPGNLQYQASSKTWRFALNQWDAQGEIGNLTQPASETEDGDRINQSEWIDLFPWGHSGFEYDGKSFVPYHACAADNQGLYLRSQTSILEGNYADGDWGKYCTILNGDKPDAPGTWRLLSYTEFAYIAYSRSCSTIKNYVDPNNPNNKFDIYFRFLRCGIDTGLRDGKDKIIRYGVMLFPDDFTWPQGFDIPGIYWGGCDIGNKGVANENAVVYALSDFAIFEAAGVAFLPSAGYWRHEASTNRIIIPEDTFNFRGDYWTTSKSRSMVSYSRHILEEDSGGNNTNIGRSVRLVKNVPAATAEHEGVENDGDYNF